MAIRVRVLYFARAREAAGTGAEDFLLPTRSSVDALVKRSLEAHADLQAVSHGFRVAVNEELIGDEEEEGRLLLSDGDVVAFLPPVAGG